MCATLKFCKMHGCGNDFILVNGFAESLPADRGQLAERLCDRHFGIGADGLITLEPEAGYDFRMHIYQPDGSEAEMCGNGVRCAALFANWQGICQAAELNIATLAGLIRPTILAAGETSGLVRVDMGEPRLAARAIPCTLPGETVLEQPVEVSGREFLLSAVSMGNPHAVIFLETPPEQFAVTTYGPLLERHEIFPAKTNVEFAQVLDAHTIKMRVWERGVGETLACGTGACACAVAAILTKRAEAPVAIKLAGGELKIDWQPGGPVFMTGPAEVSFYGEAAL